MSFFWGSAAQGQTRWLSSTAQPDVRVIASPSSRQSSEQRHCSSLKLSHMRLLCQSSRGALGSPQANVPQEGEDTGEAQPAKHWCFLTEAASPTQGVADPPIHQEPNSKGSHAPSWRCAEVKWEMLIVRREGWGGIQKLTVTSGTY